MTSQTSPLSRMHQYRAMISQETGNVHSQNGKMLMDMLRAARTSSRFTFERIRIRGKHSAPRESLYGAIIFGVFPECTWVVLFPLKNSATDGFFGKFDKNPLGCWRCPQYSRLCETFNFRLDKQSYSGSLVSKVCTAYATTGIWGKRALITERYFKVVESKEHRRGIHLYCSRLGFPF